MEKIFRYTLTALIALLALGQFVQVVTRYILEIPVMGLEEVLIYPTLWLYMFGAMNASRENTQIRANVLDIFLKTDRAKAILASISDVISLIIGSWLFYWAWDYTKYAMRVQKETPTLYWPTIYYDYALIIGLGFILLFVTYHLFNQIRTLIGAANHD